MTKEDSMFRKLLIPALALTITPFLGDTTIAARTNGATAATFSGVVEEREITLPAGTVLPLRLDSTVASDTSRVEDGVQAHLTRSVTRAGLTVLPANAPVSGVVTEAKRSGRVKGRAIVAFRFNALNAHGEEYRVRTSSVVRQAASTVKRDAAEIGLPAAGGAIIGGIVGGGKGAAIGAAAGGGAGTGVVLTQRGKEVRLGRGALVSVRLTQPLTIRVPVHRT
jgi:hypothetical protein